MQQADLTSPAGTYTLQDRIALLEGIVEHRPDLLPECIEALERDLERLREELREGTRCPL